MKNDVELRTHRDWLNTLQPVGLVVSPPALAAGQAVPNRDIVREQQRLLSLVVEDPPAKRGLGPEPRIADFLSFAREVLEWDESFVLGRPDGPPIPDSLSVPLPAFGESLRPTYAVQDLHKSGDAPGFVLLVQVLPPRTPLDEAGPEEGRRWHASPQLRMERLLRETGVPAGLLWNGVALRLVYAPSNESSGHVTWPVAALCEVSGRLLLSALCMLLGQFRLFSAPRAQSLPHLLRESRKYQNVVSTKLAGQVLEALNELLRGFQAASEAHQGQLLDSLVREEPLHVYGGLLSSLLRLVFILYAEERGLLSGEEVYVRGYSLTGLFERLRIDDGRFPDTMDQRYGAWAQLCVLFRLVHDGARHGSLKLPPRRGHLFDPDGWPFLEGRPRVGGRQRGERLTVPKVSDGVVFRVLKKLLILDGDRLSYRALDVEQIGSVYESMMGFTLERATEVSIGVGRAHVVIGLESLLAQKATERAKQLKELADVEVTGKAQSALKDARSVADLVAAVGRRVSPLCLGPDKTPRVIGRGGLYLQPTDERRRSGSHYTPRELTEPIVRRTLEPLLHDLGSSPKPEQLLALKVCDPAMGSGAFLVEACRQLAEHLVRSWDVHGKPADLPAEEEPLLFALRLVAQRCLYGVDKNPFAVDLGKLSLWLATLAKQHSFTFVDHSVRHGDSLVGLSRQQIESFHWQPDQQIPLVRTLIDRALTRAEALRIQIQNLAASDDDDQKRALLREADDALADARLIGDCAVACFFAGETDKARKRLRAEWEPKIAAWLEDRGDRNAIDSFAQTLREGKRPIPCFHWELEFPEVFTKERKGFDAFVGNPPFLGGTMISSSFGKPYIEYLNETIPESGNRMDLAAYFLRRVFCLLRICGCGGLVATNTISQGDTRTGGLGYIIRHSGTIYSVCRRYKWPGSAAVIVSLLHISRERQHAFSYLGNEKRATINSYLFSGSEINEPAKLQANNGITYEGCKIYGQGFLFDDQDVDATPISEMRRLIERNPANLEVVFPYIGGEELNSSPTHAHHRYVINFGSMTEKEAQNWPDLMQIVEAKVKPERLAKTSELSTWPWWQFWRQRRELYSAIKNKTRILAISLVTKYPVFAWLPAHMVFSHKLCILALDADAHFSVLQSRIHGEFALFFSSSMKDDLNYSPSDCFDTFPLPRELRTIDYLNEIGKEYYDFRASLMIRNNEGLTATYNRFHDPEEHDPDIVKLRELHDAMDRAVLDAYGWTDLRPVCEFLLDYEEAEDEDEAESGRARKKKKPWRYRWPDEVRDEVLARLLALNAERAKEEARAALLAGGAEAGKAKGKGKKAKAGGDAGSGQGSLF